MAGFRASQELRRLASLAGRNRTFRRRLPAEFGNVRMYASTEGGLKYLKRDLGAIDPVLTRFARNYVCGGQTVWDIGANVGLLTFMAAARVGTSGHVLAVDADIWLISNLKRSSGLNRSYNVDALPVAVADGVRLSRFHVAKASRAANYLEGRGSTQAGGSRKAELVPTVTLDWILDEYPYKPDVLKIDVERAEASVLKGAERILSEVWPTILVEVGTEVAPEVTVMLREADYELFDAAEADCPRVGRACYSTLALPRGGRR